MKHILKIPLLLATISLMSFTLWSEVIAQNIFDIAIDPKHATTIFVNSEAKLKVETWNEDYILFQIAFEPQSEENKTLRYLELNKQHIVRQEFTVNDFLHLTMTDLDKLLLSNDCKPHQLFTYKIIAPKSLDLELRCENDLVVGNLQQESYPLDIKDLKAHDEK